jgi:hypothetical protein
VVERFFLSLAEDFGVKSLAVCAARDDKQVVARLEKATLTRFTLLE